MKLSVRLILSGVLLLALALTFAACSGGTQPEATPVAEATEAPVVEATAAPTEPPFLFWKSSARPKANPSQWMI